MTRSTRLTRSSASWAACTAGFLLAPVLMNAQLDRSRPPAPGPAPEVRLGEHATVVLPNGIRLIVVEDHKLPLVNVQVRFDVPPVVQGEKVGYVDMVGELLPAGTATRTKADIDREVDALGANFYATNDGLYAGSLKKNLGPLMELVTDVVQNPSFPAGELEKARIRFRSSVQQRHEDPEAIAEAVGRSVTFGRTHPYGEVMTTRTIGKIDRASVEAYHRHFFRPEKAYLVFVGDITLKEARDLAKTHFGKWKPRPSLVTMDEHGRTIVEGIGVLNTLDKAVTPSGVRRVYVVDRPGAAQSVIRICFPLNLVPKDIRAQRAQVMNTLLGGGVFNARLMQNLRETRGFTYGAFSTLEVDRFNSSFVATTSVRTEVTDSAVTEILAEIDRMRNGPVTAEELELARNFMMGSFGRSLEDPKTVARFALNTELNGLSADHYRTYLSRLEGITVDQVQEAANAFLHPDQASILVVGDVERCGRGLAMLGQEERGMIRLNEDGAPWEEELTPVKDRTAEQVIEAYLTAIGGREAIAPLRHLSIDQRIVRGQDTLSCTEWFAPDQYRSTVKSGSFLEEEYIHDGSRVLYNADGVTGEVTDAGYEAISYRGQPVPEVTAARRMEKLVLLGSTTLGEQEAYKVAFITRSGTKFAMYFDARTGLKLRRTEEFFFNGRSFQQRMDFADWKAINGVLFPHTIIEQGGPTGDQVRTITHVEVNKPMPPTFFDVVIPEMPDMPVPPEMLPPTDNVPVDE